VLTQPSRHKRSPDRLNPDWWRFLTGGVCRVGEPLVDPTGVPPLGVVVRSNTGPSYMPRGTACISPICHRREEDSDSLCSQGAPRHGSSMLRQALAPQSHRRGNSRCLLRAPPSCTPKTSLQRRGLAQTHHPPPAQWLPLTPTLQSVQSPVHRFTLHRWGRRRTFCPTSSFLTRHLPPDSCNTRTATSAGITQC